MKSGKSLKMLSKLILDHGKGKPKVKTVDMGAPVYSSPVVANGVLYVATQTHLYAIGK